MLPPLHPVEDMSRCGPQVDLPLTAPSCRAPLYLDKVSLCVSITDCSHNQRMVSPNRMPLTAYNADGCATSFNASCEFNCVLRACQSSHQFRELTSQEPPTLSSYKSATDCRLSAVLCSALVSLKQSATGTSVIIPNRHPKNRLVEPTFAILPPAPRPIGI